MGPHRALIEDISIVVSLSDRSWNPLHREHIGSRETQDSFESDAYALKVTLRQVALERESPMQTMPLARFGRVELQGLVYQWPTPFLNPSPFLQSDGNASLLAVHLKVDSLHFADQIDKLRSWLAFLQSRRKKSEESFSDPSNSQMVSLPKLVIALETGPMIARIIYDSNHGEDHRAVELRSNGLVLVLKSEYRHPTMDITRLFPAASSVQSMHWSSSLSLNLNPILVRVRSKHDPIKMNSSTSDADFLDDPPILSIGNLEVSLITNAIAQVDGAGGTVAVIDKTSLAAEFAVAFETICVELWHPISVDAILRLISMVPAKRTRLDAQIPAKSRFVNLPSGLSAKIAVERMIFFVTAPDISPNDGLDLSRGFSIRTTLAFEYCSLRTNHIHWFDHPQRTQNRSRLHLIPEAIPESIIAAKAPASTQETVSLLKLRVAKFVFREAVATPFEPDEPVIVGREESSPSTQDIMRICNIQVDVSLSSKMPVGGSQCTDFAGVSVQIPMIYIDFQLRFAYSILLSLQTIRLLKPAQPTFAVSHPEQKMPFVLSIHGAVKKIQGSIALPTEKLLLSMDALHVTMNTGATPKIKWRKSIFFVPLPSHVGHCQVLEEEWDELVILQAWEVSFTPLAGSLCIAIDGESAKFCIPHGFVLADLVQDINISAKVIRHLASMTNAGHYFAMPSPEAEGPKSVPHLTIRLGCLSLEAMDDPFESKLGLIWQISEAAVKQRMEREEAFKAKVRAILAAEPELFAGTASQFDSEHDFAFDARHTVSIQEARRRLDDVHVLDWSLRLQRARDQQSKSANSIVHDLRATTGLQPGVLPDPIHLRSRSSAPPLVKLMLQNLCLIVSPPSFSIDQLPDVLHRMGEGLPRDTEFSLLVPLHTHFTLSSLHAILRDYPLPLVYIPARAKSSVSLIFDSDLVIGEEMGTERTVEWIECPIIESRHALHGERPFSISVPKTIMPVKTYAAPNIKISTPEPTILSWAVSYMPAIQDVMRIVDSLTTPPRDSSPAMGFWDKVGSFIPFPSPPNRIFTAATRTPLDSQGHFYG